MSSIDSLAGIVTISCPSTLVYETGAISTCRKPIAWRIVYRCSCGIEEILACQECYERLLEGNGICKDCHETIGTYTLKVHPV